MCGIVGYTGKRAAQEIILAGLEKLEYRGYDSAGISLVEDDGLDAVRAVGNLSHLRAAVEARSAGEAEAAASRSPPGRPTPASATPAGPRTAA